MRNGKMVGFLASLGFPSTELAAAFGDASIEQSFQDGQAQPSGIAFASGG